MHAFQQIGYNGDDDELAELTSHFLSVNEALLPPSYNHVEAVQSSSRVTIAYTITC